MLSQTHTHTPTHTTHQCTNTHIRLGISIRAARRILRSEREMLSKSSGESGRETSLVSPREGKRETERERQLKQRLPAGEKRLRELASNSRKEGFGRRTDSMQDGEKANQDSSTVSARSQEPASDKAFELSQFCMFFKVLRLRA